MKTIIDQIKAMGVDPAQCFVDGKPFEQVFAKDGTPIRSAVKAVKYQQRVEGDPYKSTAERIYAADLAKWQQAGVIRRWAYEPVKFHLPDWGWYIVDFQVVLADGSMEFIELKGRGKYAIRDRAKAKFLDARRLFPEFTFKMLQWDGEGFLVVL